MLTRRRVIVALTALLTLDVIVLAWMVWLLNHGSNSAGALGEVVRLIAFLSFPLLVVALAVVLELAGGRTFRHRGRRDPV